MHRIFLTAFALMVLLPSAAFARSEYLCKLDGQVRSSCCCPAKVQKHEAPRPASVRDACCCTIVEAAPSRVQLATADSANDRRSPVPVFIAYLPIHAAPPLSTISISTPWPRAIAPPDHHRHLFVRHCAFLL